MALMTAKKYLESLKEYETGERWTEFRKVLRKVEKLLVIPMVIPMVGRWLVKWTAWRRVIGTESAKGRRLLDFAMGEMSMERNSDSTKVWK